MIERYVIGEEEIFKRDGKLYRLVEIVPEGVVDDRIVTGPRGTSAPLMGIPVSETRQVTAAPHVRKNTGKRGCSICTKQGHNAKTCPENGPKDQDEDDEVRTTLPAHSALTDDELRVQVPDLQKQGLDSLRIAAKLKVPLRKVNEFWQYGIAVEQAKGEEGFQEQ